MALCVDGLQSLVTYDKESAVDWWWCVGEQRVMQQNTYSIYYVIYKPTQLGGGGRGASYGATFLQL